MNTVEKQVRQEARARVGEGSAGHTKGCMCPECVQHKARVEDEAERIAQSVVAGVRESAEADAQYEQRAGWPPGARRGA